MKQVKLIGNEKALERLKKLLPASRVIFLSGPSGVGKFHAAEQAALLVADIGDCVSHRGRLGVEYVRDVIQQSYFKASGTKGRAFILECEEFSAEAMNAMLKVLEEPPDNTYFFLVSSIQLPSTIISRCQRVGFRAMTSPEVHVALLQEGWSGSQADHFAGAGSVGKALLEYSCEEARTNVTTFLAACNKMDWDLITRCATKWGSLEISLLADRMLRMAQADIKKRSDMIALADWLAIPVSCSTLTFLLAARLIIMKKIV